MTDLMPDFSDPTHNGTQRPIHIPIRSLMPEPTDAVEYMAMPREMTTFSMPSLPEPGPDTDVAGARDVLDTFVGHMSAWLDQAGDGGTLPALDLAGLPAAPVMTPWPMSSSSTSPTTSMPSSTWSRRGEHRPASLSCAFP